MTFREIESALVNGLHDAFLTGVCFDPVLQIVTLKMSVDVSTEGSGSERVYRTVSVVATGVSLFFIEPPDSSYPYAIDGEAIQASGDGDFQGLDTRTEHLINQLPIGADRYRFFFDNWNSFLYLAAQDVTYSWIAS